MPSQVLQSASGQKKLFQKLGGKKQVYCLLDCSPFLAEVYSLIKVGAETGAAAQPQVNLGAESTIWLGLHPADLKELP